MSGTYSTRALKVATAVYYPYHHRPPQSQASTVPNFDFFFSFLRDFSARMLSRDSCVCLRHAPLIFPSSITTRVVLPHSPIQTSSLTRYEQAVSVTRPYPSMRNALQSRNKEIGKSVEKMLNWREVSAICSWRVIVRAPTRRFTAKREALSGYGDT